MTVTEREKDQLMSRSIRGRKSEQHVLTRLDRVFNGFPLVLLRMDFAHGPKLVYMQPTEKQNGNIRMDVRLRRPRLVQVCSV